MLKSNSILDFQKFRIQSNSTVYSFFPQFCVDNMVVFMGTFHREHRGLEV